MPITYDAMGNPTSYLGKTLTWEGKRLMSYTNGSTSITYAYNEDGLRLSKTVGTNKTEYYYNGSVLIGMKIGTGSTAKFLRFSYDASGNVVAVDYSIDNGSNFTTYYYLRNAQNDVIKLIDGSGNTVVEYTYDSWGKLLSVTGSLSSTLGADQPFRYRGYVYDTETQLYYLQSRYYDPSICRFISSDVYLSTGQGVLGHNSFAYCLNNPANGTDPSGHLFRRFNMRIADTCGKGTASLEQRNQNDGDNSEYYRRTGDYVEIPEFTYMPNGLREGYYTVELFGVSRTIYRRYEIAPGVWREETVQTVYFQKNSTSGNNYWAQNVALIAGTAALGCEGLAAYCNLYADQFIPMGDYYSVVGFGFEIGGIVCSGLALFFTWLSSSSNN